MASWEELRRLAPVNSQLATRNSPLREQYLMFVPCPYCGARDHSEFRYGGDASKTRPALGETNIKIWHDHVFVFDNPRGPHKEYWQHVLGCRQWILVERDTLTQAIAGSGAASG